MVNELVPLVMMLTNLNAYNYVFYDEIETCLHPLKQIEMARLVVRLVNSNYKMVISTHSDTMAIALNNLILLSHLKNRDIKAEKFGYNKEDFFKNDDIHVYQFKSYKGKQPYRKSKCIQISILVLILTSLINQAISYILMLRLLWRAPMSKFHSVKDNDFIDGICTLAKNTLKLVFPNTITKPL